MSEDKPSQSEVKNAIDKVQAAVGYRLINDDKFLVVEGSTRMIGPDPATECEIKLWELAVARTAVGEMVIEALDQCIKMLEPDTSFEDIRYRAAHGPEMLASAKKTLAKAVFVEKHIKKVGTNG